MLALRLSLSLWQPVFDMCPHQTKAGPVKSSFQSINAGIIQCQYYNFANALKPQHLQKLNEM